MSKSNPEEQSFFNEEAWSEILESLIEEKCILCLGPGVYTQPGEPRMEQQLASFLRENEEELNISVYDDGWFHYSSKSTKVKTHKKIKRFYTQENPRVEKLFDKLSSLPFHFILNFVPDYKLRNTFDQKNFDYNFQSYIKKERFDESTEIPSKQQPLIYNILGEIQQNDSLVLGYNDFYLYLESIFEKNSMSPKLVENIHKAEYFLFLGLSFDKWYVHLFMRMLKQHDLNSGSEKYAVNLPLQRKEIETHCFEQYSLTSIPSNIENFILEFYDRCKSKGILRQPKTIVGGHAEDLPLAEPIFSNIDFDKLRKDFVRNEFERIFETLTPLLIQLGKPAIEALDKIRFFQSQYYELKRDRVNLLIREEEYSVRMANLKKSILQFINLLEKQFPNPNQ